VNYKEVVVVVSCLFEHLATLTRELRVCPPRQARLNCARLPGQSYSTPPLGRRLFFLLSQGRDLTLVLPAVKCSGCPPFQTTATATYILLSLLLFFRPQFRVRLGDLTSALESSSCIWVQLARLQHPVLGMWVLGPDQHLLLASFSPLYLPLLSLR
jgi:hypothetical protein